MDTGPVPLTMDVAVLMRKERIVGAMSRWQEWRWVLEDVVVNEPGFGEAPRRLYADENQQRWLHPGFTVRLFKDDAEGYLLNASAPSPCWFVLWRMEESPSVADEPLARPEIVTLSYHDAGRWLDAQETVEQIPAPPDIVAWIEAFVAEHYVPEPKRRRRPASFQSLQDRFGNPASVSTVKKFGGGQP
ncbi:DUF3305 domain-containing protein [Bordetella genomosp. 13]|uniref:DUF3305 domain-containing protein n=1 Tax=Bordetella genomosp. 13 TaxID=463040 RepID=A0A1W6Z6U1_9BORD|nr:DUF3305 domain-containing protein [Bordetella genomosp. 13]ARP93146.1 hypothetical protein CAL15_01340 [Bordetella genomosp. 13]